MTHTDPEARALLRAILMHPAEDTPRLMYADWLQENGDEERAEFVRVQCRIYRNPDECGNLTCDRCSLRTKWHKYTPRCRGVACRLRQREYYTSRRFCVWDWCRGIPAGSCPVYRRGFVCEISLPLAAFMEHAKALFSAHPIERVTLTDRSPQSTRHMSRGRGRRLTWFNVNAWANASRGAASELPPELMENPWQRRANFDTEGVAHAWLSARCVAYGRSLAGLPALEVA